MTLLAESEPESQKSRYTDHRVKWKTMWFLIFGSKHWLEATSYLCFTSWQHIDVIVKAFIKALLCTTNQKQCWLFMSLYAFQMIEMYYIHIWIHILNNWISLSYSVSFKSTEAWSSYLNNTEKSKMSICHQMEFR